MNCVWTLDRKDCDFDTSCDATYLYPWDGRGNIYYDCPECHKEVELVIGDHHIPAYGIPYFRDHWRNGTLEKT